MLRAALPRPDSCLVPGVNLQISRISWDLYFDIVAGAAPAAWTGTALAPFPPWLALAVGYYVLNECLLAF